MLIYFPFPCFHFYQQKQINWGKRQKILNFLISNYAEKTIDFSLRIIFLLEFYQTDWWFTMIVKTFNYVSKKHGTVLALFV